MPVGLSEEQVLLQQSVRRLAQERIAPLAADLDRRNEFPQEIREVLASQGIMAFAVPEEYGGTGADVTSACLILEELAKISPAVADMLTPQWIVFRIMAKAGSEVLKERYLPRGARGEIMAGFSLTEPGGGSDAASIKTRARRQGEGYLLNGQKCFTTNGGVADVYCLVAVTDPDKGTRGISMFMVDYGTKGLSRGKEEDKMGFRGLSTADVIMEDLWVPAENMLGPEGRGFHLAMQSFDQSRPLIAAMAVGLAEAALQQAIQYAKERRTFGQPIAQHQSIAFMLADMGIQIEAARSLTYRAAALCDAGDTEEVNKIAAMAKCFASDMAMKVTTDAVQILGGYGYMKDYPVERMMRDAKLMQIFEGTNQIQRIVISRRLLA